MEKLLRICFWVCALGIAGIINIVSAVGWDKLTDSNAASWVQAFGSILALAVAIGLSVKQARDGRHAEWLNRLRETSQKFSGFIAIAGALTDSVQTAIDILSDGSRDRREAFLESEYSVESYQMMLSELQKLSASALPTVSAIRTALSLRDACESMVTRLKETAQWALDRNYELPYYLAEVQVAVDRVGQYLDALRGELVRATHPTHGVLDHPSQER